jgi:hypothetical protein
MPGKSRKQLKNNKSKKTRGGRKQRKTKRGGFLSFFGSTTAPARSAPAQSYSAPAQSSYSPPAQQINSAPTPAPSNAPEITQQQIHAATKVLQSSPSTPLNGQLELRYALLGTRDGKRAFNHEGYRKYICNMESYFKKNGLSSTNMGKALNYEVQAFNQSGKYCQ